MKSPQQYLADHGCPWTDEAMGYNTPNINYEAALKAVADALADCEKYKNMLVGAIRRSSLTPSPPPMTE